MKNTFARFMRGLAFLLLCQPNLALAAPLHPLTLQLKWTHSFQFAGYYAAQAKGFYQEAGLDVHFLEAQPGIDPVEQVLSGKAEFGVGSSSLLLSHFAQNPIVVLAVIFQHSPLVLLARQETPNQSIQSLEGKRVMMEPHADELLAYLKLSGIDPKGLIQIPHSFGIQELVKGNVDAISAYSCHEPYYTAKAGIPLQIYTPRAAGVDFYGDNLFTTRQELNRHPDQVRAFREASLHGWQYALAHPEEVAQLIYERYSQEHDLDFYRFQAQQIRFLMQPDLIEPGYMHLGRWQYMAQVYADLGLLPPNASLDGFLYDAQLRDEDLRWIYAGTFMVLLAYGVALYTWNTNRRLQNALQKSQETEQALRISEERYRLLADNAADVIWTLNLQGHCTYVSPSVMQLRGYSVYEVMQHNLHQALSSDSLRRFRQRIDEVLTAVRQQQPIPETHLELEQLRKDGSSVWTETTVSALYQTDGALVGLLCVTRDITARRHVEQQMRHMARHDALTGLPNRALFSERLQQALASARRHQHLLGVLFIDFDAFKPINDTYGHAAGDKLLQEAAQRMHTCLRTNDTLARIGGDEFVALISHVTDRNALELVSLKIQYALVDPFYLEGHPVGVCCSIGAALFPEDGLNEVSLCKHADQAMYNAKRAKARQTPLANAARDPVSPDGP